MKNETNALRSVLFFITRRFPASFSQVPMNLSISDIIFHPFRTRCSHHSISSSPLLPASEHPAWPALWMFFQSQHACTSGSSYKPMRAFRGTAHPSSPLRSALRRIVGKPWTVSAKYRRCLWAVGFLFPFLFLSCEHYL